MGACIYVYTHAHTHASIHLYPSSYVHPRCSYWDGCHIIRNAGHVIQLNCGGRAQRPEFKGLHPSVAFQEFSPEFNHVPWSVGIAGRPGGPDWYFNLVRARFSLVLVSLVT